MLFEFGLLLLLCFVILKFSPFKKSEKIKLSEKLANWKNPKEIIVQNKNFTFFQRTVEKQPISPLNKEIKEQKLDYSQLKKIPKDEENYTKSFLLDQKKELKEFFSEFGFVIVRDVISKEECKITENDVWEGLEDMNPKFKRNDPLTWETFPSLSHLGILGNDTFMSIQAMKNRQNENVYQTFVTLLEDEDLLVSIDRVSLMRPTKNVQFLDGKRDKPEWITNENWLHLDMNPLSNQVSRYGFRYKSNETPGDSKKPKLQGILALVDCTESEGGLLLVPGFHKVIKSWASENFDHCVNFGESSLDPTTVPIPSGDKIRNYAQKTSLRKGSILIWDSRLPHCTYSNSSSNPRMIMYLKMFSKDTADVLPLLDENEFPENFVPSKLGRKLFGIDKK